MMRTLLVSVIITSILSTSQAQDDPSEFKELFTELDSVSSILTTDTIYITEHPPMFHGGNEALQKWLMDQTRLINDKNANVNGRVILEFIVSSEGQVIADSIKVVRTTDPKLNNFARDILAKSPRWIPGKRSTNNNQPPVPVDYRMNCAVHFIKE